MPFSLRLYVTQAPASGVTEGGLSYESGRPDLYTLVDQWVEREGIEGGGQEEERRRSSSGSRNQMAMLVCGPTEMMLQARNAGIAKGIAVHEEIFHW